MSIDHNPLSTVDSLFNAGVHLGHSSRNTHPNFNQFIFEIQSKTAVIDLSLTRFHLIAACDLLFNLVASNKRVMFVGTRDIHRRIITKHALQSGQYYVCHKWIGGMITNFSTINAMNKKMNDIDEILENAPKYDLKSRQINSFVKNSAKLKTLLGGFNKMKKRPEVIILTDPKKDYTAVLEAKRFGITTIGIIDSDTDPSIVDYAIPGNNDSVTSVDLFLQVLSDAILQGVKRGIISKNI